MSEILDRIEALEKRISDIEMYLQTLRDSMVASLEADVQRSYDLARADAAALNLMVGINRAMRGEKEE